MDAERTAVLVCAVLEGLLNVEKHSGASSVVVSLNNIDDAVQVAVADDSGAGTDPGGLGGMADTGLGVRTLVERAARLGGRVSLVRDEDGAPLRTWVPAIRSRDNR